jgi:hypothetical protein
MFNIFGLRHIFGFLVQLIFLAYLIKTLLFSIRYSILWVSLK